MNSRITENLRTAHTLTDSAAGNLRAALNGAGAVQARALLELIGRAAALARDVDSLREITAELLAERDDLRTRLEWAEDAAERWRDDALQAIEHAGARPGLTVDGRLHCLATP